MAEMGQTNRDDGMFWMDVDDFGLHFTTITYVDLVPSHFTVLRADAMWGPTTAGGIHSPYWNKNPQLIMNVKQRTDSITISLNQPDTRMQFSPLHKSPPLDKDDFWNLYAGDHNPVGYENGMLFMVFKGGVRKQNANGIFAKSAFSELRTLSIVMKVIT